VRSQKRAEEARLAAEKTVAADPAPASTASRQYRVVKGDNLWDVSAKPSIYNNPYQWPLIYKANSDKIKDADLIYPGQSLRGDTAPSSAQIKAAVSHTRSHRAWSLSTVESTDKAFLAQ